jgi:hypothetical protein
MGKDVLGELDPGLGFGSCGFVMCADVWLAHICELQEHLHAFSEYVAGDTVSRILSQHGLS